MPTQLFSFTENELIDELRTLLVELAHSFCNLLPKENWLGLLGITPKQVGNGSPSEDELLSIDIEGFRVTQLMRRLYQYGVRGVLVEQLLREWDEVQDDVVALFDSVANFPLMANNMLVVDTMGAASPFWRCGTVLRLSYLRFHLDHDNFDFQCQHVYGSLGKFSLPDLAFLAGIDEKTIRNLANPKSKTPLVTAKHGPHTYVERDVALEWLKKRGFKETEFRSDSPSRDFAQHGFASRQDLASFVRHQRQARSLSQEALARLMTGIEDALVIVQNIENDCWEFPEAGIEALAAPMTAMATGLEVSVRGFVLAVYQLHTKEQALKLEALLRQSSTPAWGSW